MRKEEVMRLQICVGSDQGFEVIRRIFPEAVRSHLLVIKVKAVECF